MEERDPNPSKLISQKVNLWIQKWTENKVLDNTWNKFIEPLVVALRENA